MLMIDGPLLDQSTLSLFMEDSSMSEEIKQTIQQLAHAAMQNQKIELSDVLKVIKQDSIQEAEEALLVSEDLRTKREQEIAQVDAKAKDALEQKARDFEREKWDHEADMIVLKATEDRKTQIQEQTILSMGFNEDKDMDSDGVPDILEVAKHGVDAEIKRGQLAKDNRALDFQIQDSKEKNKLKAKEIASKNASTTK